MIDQAMTRSEIALRGELVSGVKWDKNFKGVTIGGMKCSTTSELAGW
jgi:hypothetical protein